MWTAIPAIVVSRRGARLRDAVLAQLEAHPSRRRRHRLLAIPGATIVWRHCDSTQQRGHFDVRQ
jgi:hypothetical protein